MRQVGVIYALVFSILGMTGLTSNSLSSEFYGVSGMLTSSQNTLPQGAIAYITLVDVSPRQDVERSIIARQTITDLRQLPISFELEYSPEKIRTDHLYAIQVQVTTEGRPVLRNSSAYPVITQGNPSVVEIRLEPSN